MKKRTDSEVDKLVANVFGMKDWQIVEINEARKNLLAGIKIPTRAKKFLEAGGKFCRLHSQTEWECVFESADDPKVKELLKKIKYKVEL